MLGFLLCDVFFLKRLLYWLQSNLMHRFFFFYAIAFLADATHWLVTIKLLWCHVAINLASSNGLWKKTLCCIVFPHKQNTFLLPMCTYIHILALKGAERKQRRNTHEKEISLFVLNLSLFCFEFYLVIEIGLNSSSPKVVFYRAQIHHC